jgi:hypothetical protein
MNARCEPGIVAATGRAGRQGSKLVLMSRAEQSRAFAASELESVSDSEQAVSRVAPRWFGQQWALTGGPRAVAALPGASTTANRSFVGREAPNQALRQGSAALTISFWAVQVCKEKSRVGLILSAGPRDETRHPMGTKSGVSVYAANLHTPRPSQWRE